MQFDPKLFRSALGAFATGVTIVTTKDGKGGDVGMTANSFNSVSLDPPMVLWSLAKSSSNIAAFQNCKSFAVHILAADQDSLSAQFARKGIDRFDGIQMERGRDQIPLLTNCTARFECETAFQHEGGDHIIFVGEVKRFSHSQRAPLVFHGGRYGWVVGRDGEGTPLPNGQPSSDEGNLTANDLLFHIGRAYHHLRGGAVHERRRRGLSEAEYQAIGVLSMQGDMKLSEIRELMLRRGYNTGLTEISDFRNRGFVTFEEPLIDDSIIYLTAGARRTYIEIISIAKAAEADALRSFDPSEKQVLRRLLERIVGLDQQQGANDD